MSIGIIHKKTKRITTNSILYMAASGVMASYGVYTQDTYKIAFAMWMVQAANYFKKDEKDDDVAGRECSLHHNHHYDHGAFDVHP